MYRQAWLLVLAVAAGVLIGALGASTWSADSPLASDSAEISAMASIRQARPDPSDEPTPEHLADAVESLAKVLNAEINERRLLAEQLQELKSELLDLQRNLRVRVEAAFQEENGARGQESGNTVTRTRDERLAAAGFTRQQLESIDRLQAEAQMAWIELDDRARREGWLNTERYFRESRALTSGRTVIRKALGNELYDRYLFASGSPNRIAVASVIETSPAQDAGFQRGDVVISYDGEKVYSNQQLVDLRSAGVRGEPVPVEVRRNGELLQLTIPRGPMGLSMMPTRIDPADE
ncbi:MAG TPA: PDZ domain-containing protein [Woeseiaceae bacterium]|nr:PDZ domain-containing protein [Woeseiaceae bacterium]